MLLQALCIISQPSVNSNWSYSPETPNLGQIQKFWKLCIISQPSVNSNWSYSPETPNLGQIQQFWKPWDLEIWQMTLQNNRAPLLCYFKLCASFHTHWWIQTGVSLETLNSGQKRRLFEPCDLEILRMTLKNNRASLLCYFKLCVSLRTHWRIRIGVTVRKRPIWVKFDDF